MLRLTTLLAALTLAGAAQAAEPTGDLTVTFQNLKAKTGAVMLSLAASEDACGGKAAPAAQAAIPVSGDTVSTTFKGLQHGRSAIKAFHDVNGDGQMGANPSGTKGRAQA